MYIKNQTFNDTETLEETLFDFELGVFTPVLKQLQEDAIKSLATDEEFLQYRDGLEDAEEKAAVEDEQRIILVTDALLERYDKFEVLSQKFYGIKNETRELLAEIDLV